MIKGSCYCKNIHFEIEGDLRPVVFCHCSQCRKISGHFVAASQTKKADISIKGSPKWFSSSEGHYRGFCDKCGTQLFWHEEASDMMSIMAGAFDSDKDLFTGKHIYVEDKASYYQICEALPDDSDDQALSIGEF